MTTLAALDLSIEKVEESRLPNMDFDNLTFGRAYADHMFITDYDGTAWVNSRIVPYGSLLMSPATSALHYGQAIFEGLKAYRNEAGQVMVFRPDENLKRLNKSAVRMCMPELPEEIYFQALNELLRLDAGWIPQKQGMALYIRPFMFATDAYVGLQPSLTYRFMIFCSPVGAYYKEPVRVKIETHYTRAVAGGTGFAKAAGNYAGSLYPAKLAQQQGYHQLIWTDAITHSYIEEAGTMNVMFVLGDTLVTPPAGDTVLSGITRKSVLTLVKDWGVRVEERRVSVREVIDHLEAGTLKEAFGVGTAATISPICLIGFDGRDYEIPVGSTEAHLSVRILQTLNDIRYGRIPDTYQWVHLIQTAAPALS
ncbi:MAG: branched-chain amino acid aminotransferase [Bernardetiaceae bacterium]